MSGRMLGLGASAALLLVASVAQAQGETSPSVRGISSGAGRLAPHGHRDRADGRVSNRVTNRVQNRIYSRIERSYNPTANKKSPLEVTRDPSSQ